MTKSPYELLGVDKNADAETITKAYRKLAMRYHPDRVAESEKAEAEEHFKEVKEAYEILSDADRRSKYDYQQSTSRNTKHAYSSGDHYSKRTPKYDWEEVFKHYYDSEYGDFDWSEELRKASGSPFNQSSAINENYFMQLDISLQEAFSGLQKPITFKANDGDHRHVLLNIPAGIATGGRIRCANAGAHRNKSKPAGDLYVNITVLVDDRYAREGDNLVITEPVPVLKLLGGTVIRIKTIDNKEFDVTIRPGTKPGTRIRIPGQGMPIYQKAERGDLLIELEQVWPEKITVEEAYTIKALYS